MSYARRQVWRPYRFAKRCLQGWPAHARSESGGQILPLSRARSRGACCACGRRWPEAPQGASAPDACAESARRGQGQEGAAAMKARVMSPLARVRAQRRELRQLMARVSQAAKQRLREAIEEGLIEGHIEGDDQVVVLDGRIIKGKIIIDTD